MSQSSRGAPSSAHDSGRTAESREQAPASDHGETGSALPGFDDDASMEFVVSAGPATEAIVGEASGGVAQTAPAGPAAPMRDLTRDAGHGGLRSTVLWLALPVLGEQVLNTFVAWNDMFLAGHIGVSATAAVGCASYVSWLISMLFGLVGTGATAIVARSVGARAADEARRATNQAFVVSLVVGIVCAAGVPLAAPYVAGWFRPTAETHSAAVRFMRIDANAYIIESFTFIAAACLRGAGDTRTPMKVLGVVNLVNMLMSWFCAFRVTTPAWMNGAGIGTVGLGMGSDGIAWGTVIARYVGGAMMLVVMARGRAGLGIVPAWMRPDPKMVWRIVRVGGPAAIDGGLVWTGQMAFVAIVARAGHAGVGDTIFAAHFVGIRIESLSYMPAMAWMTAAATLVGQNLGARLPERARRCAREAALQTVILLSFMGVVYFLFAAPLYRFLTTDAQVVRAGVPALRGLALVQPALAVLIVLIGALRGAGDTTVPMIITLVGMLFVRIPLAYLGGVVMGWGLVGAWLGMYGDLVVRAVLMTARFRTGRWAHVRV